MQPHPRIRKTIKWAGAALTVLLVGVWIGSGWWMVSPQVSSTVSVGICDGCVRVVNAPAAWGPTYGRSVWFERNPAVIVVVGPSWEYRFHMTFWPRNFRSGRTFAVWDLPVWIVALPTGVLTAFAWYRDTLARRRARLNLCPTCHYDRTGLASPGGMCPECGSPPPPPRSAP